MIKDGLDLLLSLELSASTWSDLISQSIFRDFWERLVTAYSPFNPSCPALAPHRVEFPAAPVSNHRTVPFRFYWDSPQTGIKRVIASVAPTSNQFYPAQAWYFIFHFSQFYLFYFYFVLNYGNDYFFILYWPNGKTSTIMTVRSQLLMYILVKPQSSPFAMSDEWGPFKIHLTIYTLQPKLAMIEICGSVLPQP